MITDKKQRKLPTKRVFQHNDVNDACSSTAVSIQEPPCKKSRNESPRKLALKKGEDSARKITSKIQKDQLIISNY